jgi:N-acetylglutamate synthase
LRSETLPDWLALYCRMSGKAPEQQLTHTAILQATPSPRIFASLWDGDQAVACAIGILHAQALSIVDVVTDPQHRQQGYATALLCQIFAWAQRIGAGDATLQVQGDNAAARALYTRLGFREAYAYWYRVRHLAQDA